MNSKESDNAKNSLKKLFFSPYLWCFVIIMIGLWLFCWAAWGGTITTNPLGPPGEAGLGINPPELF